jgi:hypothetical protein
MKDRNREYGRKWEERKTKGKIKQNMEYIVFL